MVASNFFAPLRGGAICRVRFLLLLTALVGILLCPGRFAWAEKRVYSIQVGAYRNIKGAEKVVSEMKKLGHHAFFQKENIKNKGRWYRVYIEKYPSENKAREEGKILKELGLISEYAVRPIETPGPAVQKRGEKVFYFLHVSSFREEAHAERLSDRLIAQGQKAFHVSETMAGEKWFRVYIGEFESGEAARRAGEILREKGVIQYFKAVKIDRAALTPEN